MRLARVGIESVAGFLEGGVGAWRDADREIVTLPQLEVRTLHDNLESGRLRVVDVRAPGEYQGGHVPGAVNIPLNVVEHRLDLLDASQPTAVICAGGYRSSAAASLLQKRGFEVMNVVGGTGAWIAAGLALESNEEQATSSK
ncbi:MAG TPA: rhodanese-like domain-containing protein [Thermoanaerobaculia bacterium]|nr:rhodanese-like domain-containing protein [Thermoanaerobaculia bacterium]